jgi:hypothetical protein
VDPGIVAGGDHRREGGENALLVQPGGRIPGFLATAGNSTGPSLWRHGACWDEHIPVELRIGMSALDLAAEQALENRIAQREAERAGAFLEMLRRYGASARAARARRSYDRVMDGTP